jgi:hypothetical protein
MSLLVVVFSGIHMGLLGFAIIMWGVFPRWLGYIAFLSGPILILNSFLYMYWPGYDGSGSLIFMAPVAIAELWFAGWLLVNTPHPSKNRDIVVSSLWRDEQK